MSNDHMADGPGAATPENKAGRDASDSGPTQRKNHTLNPHPAQADREGTARPSLNLVAGQVLAPYALARKRKAVAQAAEPRQQLAGEDFGAAGDWTQGDHE